MISRGDIPLNDLQAQHRSLQGEIERAVLGVLESQSFILGAPVAEFERSVAEFLGAEDAVGVSSGTDALLVSLLDAGVGAGDEVITTALTFVATAEAIARVGARPVFVDVEDETGNLDPQRVKEALTPRTKAILVVHLFGHPARVDELRALARAADLVLIEDAAQAFGGRLGGRALGTWGEYGALSFFPSKILGGAGDGGMVVTDAERGARLRALRIHGTRDKERFERLGGNFRLDALQAAILSVKLPHVDRWLDARERWARLYDERFAASAAFTERARIVPAPGGDARSARNYYVLRARERDALGRSLKTRGISSAAYYRIPLHQQPCFARREGEESLPVTEGWAREILALPLYPELGEAAARRVSDEVLAFFEGTSK